ncbi:MAG TPA: BlaI/MecI/CopY family transcriptional regulator [Arachnia sp.]|nr:BlaI/MecI/CopY family transcriptional regulator [Arachnia sp.]HMT84829.1 BlaI/MecI/CopY family transcriptional regulator [Arachnia sp.]
MTSRGELEQRVMEVLWQADVPQSVADVHAELNLERELAYTTVMTVLDRLAKKHRVTRTMSGRAWQYVPSTTRPTYVASRMYAGLSELTAEDRAEALRQLVAVLSPEDKAILVSG